MTTVRVEQGDITQSDADAIVVNLFEGVKSPGGGTGAVDAALDGAISALIADKEITGKQGETATIHTLGKLPARRVVVAGLGKRERFDTDVVRFGFGRRGATPQATGCEARRGHRPRRGDRRARRGRLSAGDGGGHAARPLRVQALPLILQRQRRRQVARRGHHHRTRRAPRADARGGRGEGNAPRRVRHPCPRPRQRARERRQPPRAWPRSLPTWRTTQDSPSPCWGART